MAQTWQHPIKAIIGYGNGGRQLRRTVASRFYRAGSIAGVSGADGSGFHPVIVRTCARTFALSVMPEVAGLAR